YSSGMVAPRKPASPTRRIPLSGHHSSASIRSDSGYSLPRANRSAWSRTAARSGCSSNRSGWLEFIGHSSLAGGASAPVDEQYSSLLPPNGSRVLIHPKIMIDTADEAASLITGHRL